MTFSSSSLPLPPPSLPRSLPASFTSLCAGFILRRLPCWVWDGIMPVVGSTLRKQPGLWREKRKSGGPVSLLDPREYPETVYTMILSLSTRFSLIPRLSHSNICCFQREGLVKLVTYSDIQHWEHVWRSGTFQWKPQLSEHHTGCNHRLQNHWVSTSGILDGVSWVQIVTP